MIQIRGFRSTLISISSISLLAFLFVASAAFPQEASPPSPEPTFKRRTVQKVDLVGVRSFPQSDIKKLLFTKPKHWYSFFRKRELSRSNVLADVSTIKRFYEVHGFLFTAVEPFIPNEPKNKASVTFYVHEGKQTYLSDVKIMGGKEDTNRKFNKILFTFDIGKPINAEEAVSGGFRLRDIYFDNGYPYSRIVNRYVFSEDSSRATITYLVTDSTFTVDGSTRVGRIGLTKHYVALRELVIKPGKMYKQQDVIDSEQRLYSTGLFKYLGLHKDDSTAVIRNDTCHVDFVLNVEERKPYFTNAGIGLGREQYFDMVLHGSFQWGNRNIMGTGRKIIFNFVPGFQITDSRGKLSTVHLSDLGRRLRFTLIRATSEIDYVEPWFLNLRLPATVKLIYEPYTLNPILAYRYDRVAGEAVFSRELDKFTTVRFTASTEYIRIRNVPPGQEQAFRAEGNNQIRRALQLYGERDTRDNFLVPQRGSYSFVGLDYVGNILGGDFGYIKTQFSWSRYRLLVGQNILATRIWLGYLNDQIKNGRSSAEDRFIIGGSTTIRGYTENSLGPQFTPEDNPGDKLGKPKGGRYLMLGNIEIRRPLFWRFGGTAFVDAGNTYSHFKEITSLSIRFTTGLGLEFFTPIGPLRFDYGVRLKKEFDLSNGLYDLAILYAF